MITHVSIVIWREHWSNSNKGDDKVIVAKRFVVICISAAGRRNETYGSAHRRRFIK